MIDPVAYTANNYTQRKGVLQLMNKYSKELKSMSGLCMDIGCGPGDVTKDILLPALHSNATIIGADFSKNMLNYACERYGDEKRISFDFMDIQTENVPKKYISAFDHIFSFYTLHWCDEINRAFQNIYSMLRPQGTILLNMICKHDGYDVLRDLSKDPRYSQYIKIRKTIFHYCTDPQGEMEKLLNNVGYRIHNCSVRRMTTHYENLDKLISMLMSFTKLFVDIPPELQQEFKKDFTNAYRSNIKHRSHNPEKTSYLDEYKLLVVYASKNV